MKLREYNLKWLSSGDKYKTLIFITPGCKYYITTVFVVLYVQCVGFNYYNIGIYSIM